jgi:hypothetical protein
MLHFKIPEIPPQHFPDPQLLGSQFAFNRERNKSTIERVTLQMNKKRKT